MGRQFIFLALIVILGAHEAIARNLQDSSMQERHKKWMVSHGRFYKNVNEKVERFRIFKENVEQIESFNIADNQLYKLGVNQFADLTNEEFKTSRNRFKAHVCSPQVGMFLLLWTGGRRELSRLSKIKVNVVRYYAFINRKNMSKSIYISKLYIEKMCRGCCWAFSAVAATEGITKMTTGKLVSLSEQELVDCDTKGVDQGSQGGLMDDAFKFMIKNKGLAVETKYPYTGVDGTCSTKEEANPVAKITGYEDVPANSETALLKAVANQPISVVIDAGGFEFQFYSSGVFTGACGTSLDHGVTAVGYGLVRMKLCIGR